jgi:peptidoglycan biosynthesis protein MviN/MurJ (putative lipid II flippase)
MEKLDPSSVMAETPAFVMVFFADLLVFFSAWYFSNLRKSTKWVLYSIAAVLLSFSPVIWAVLTLPNDPEVAGPGDGMVFVLFFQIGISSLGLYLCYCAFHFVRWLWKRHQKSILKSKQEIV